MSAAKELKKEVEVLDGEAIQRELSQHRTRWTFGPPGAPHFNGVCEALVKVAKKALTKTLERADFTDEELLTAFCKAEGLLNSRPLTAVSSDPDDRPPLTPGDFITGPSRVEIAPSASNEGCSLRQRWRRLQQLNTVYASLVARVPADSAGAAKVDRSSPESEGRRSGLALLPERTSRKPADGEGGEDVSWLRRPGQSGGCENAEGASEEASHQDHSAGDGTVNYSRRRWSEVLNDMRGVIQGRGRC